MIKRIPNIAASYGLNDILSAMNMAKDPAIIDKFTLSLSDFLKAGFVYPVNSGVAAFYLILEALKEGSSKREVILPAYTAGSLVVAVQKAGLKPVLCDIALEDFNLNASLLQNSLTNDSLAVLGVHMFGIGMENIGGIKNDLPSGVTLIEDCAQAFGSRVKGFPVGSIADIGFFSFNRGKNLPLYSGGCIQSNAPGFRGRLKSLCERLTDDASADIFAKIIAFYFTTRPYIYGSAYGLISYFKETAPPRDFNVRRISALQAGLGVRSLEGIGIFLKARHEKGVFLVNGLKSEEGLVLPEFSEESFPVFNQVPVLFKDPGRINIVRKKLWDNGLEASKVYKKPLHHMFDLGYQPEDFPNACYLAEHLLALPVHQLVSGQDLTRMIGIIKENI